MIDFIETDSQFKSLEKTWRRLETGLQMRIFQTFDWCWSAWLEFQKSESGAKLWILRWHQDGKDDEVIFPFYIDAKGTLRFILDQHSDTLDAVYDNQHNHHMAFKEAAEAILANRQIKRVWLQKMRGEGQLLNFLGVNLKGALVYKDHAFSWLDVAKSNDVIATFSHMRSKDKADLRAIGRKAARYELRVLSSAQGNLFPKEEINSLVCDMESLIGRKSEFCPAELISFIERLYVLGKVEILELFDGPKLVALNFLLLHQSRYLSWVFLYTDSRASTHMYVKYLMTKAAETDFVFDFGVGVYSYKIGTFRPNTALTFSLRFGKSIWCHFLCSLAMNWRAAKDYLKPILKAGHS